MTLIKKTFEDFAIDEGRTKKVTKQMWKKMDADQRENALLSVIKDPDDIEQDWIDGEWKDLEGWMQRDMIIFEAKVTAKKVSKLTDDLAKKTKELKDNFAKLKKAKTIGEKEAYFKKAAKLTKEKKAIDAELELAIQNFGRDMELDPNFESMDEATITFKKDAEIEVYTDADMQDSEIENYKKGGKRICRYS